MVYFEESGDGLDNLRYLINIAAKHQVRPYPIKYLTRRDWHAEYLEEQKPPVKEIEHGIGFTRISWFDDGRFKVKRVPIVHG